MAWRTCTYAQLSKPYRKGVVLLFATRYRQSLHRSSVTSLNPSPLGLSLFNFTGVERMQLPSLNWCYHLCDVTVLPILTSLHSSSVILSIIPPSLLLSSTFPHHSPPPLHLHLSSLPLLSLSLSLSLYPLTHPSSSSSPSPPSPSLYRTRWRRSSVLTRFARLLLHTAWAQSWSHHTNTGPTFTRWGVESPQARCRKLQPNTASDHNTSEFTVGSLHVCGMGVI